MKLTGHSPIDLIINHRKVTERLFAFFLLLSLIFAPFVGVNYDLTKYLPDDASSAQAIDIMEQEFGYPGMARIMLENVSLYEAKAIKDQIEDVPSVDMVMWCDTQTNIFGSSAFIDYQDIDDYYKDGYAYIDVTFEERDSASSTHKAIYEIIDLIGDKGIVAGSAMSDTMLGPTINQQVAAVMGIAVIVIFLILTLTTTSWFEPVLFLLVMGIAIAINNGTNIIFGEISFLTNSVSSVLQLAISMDYSIFLLHSFTHEKANGAPPIQAMANAMRAAITSILSSGATTIVGFLALALMSFTIGRDMGLVLAKGVFVSLLTVLLLMPALILRFQGVIDKTQHRSFMPGFRRLGKLVYHVRMPFFIFVILIMPFCYTGQGMSNFSYGNEAVSNSPGTQVYANELAINEKFGQSNMMLALVPVGDNLTEAAMTQALEDLPYVRYATSLASTLPDGIPESFLPHRITSQLHTDTWSRVMVNVRSSGESDSAFTYATEIQQIVEAHYPDKPTYLVGVTTSTQDIRDIITADYQFVNLLSLLGVAIVVGITFKSFILPLVVLIPIEAAVYINTVMPYIYGERIMFLGFIIVSCVQLGATIDYSILLTNNYLDARAQADKKEAAIRAVTASSLSILTSGTILAVVGYGLYWMTSVSAVGGLGHLIGRGALFSMLTVLFMLPMCLLLADRFIVKPDYAQKKHERMNRIRSRKIKLPTLDALQQQHRRLHEQIRENRRRRRQRILNRLRGIPNPAPEASRRRLRVRRRQDTSAPLAGKSITTPNPDNSLPPENSQKEEQHEEK